MYNIKYNQKSRKYLLKLPPKLHLKIASIVDSLKKYNKILKTLDIKKLKWYENRYRLRVWKYRILFEKYENKLIILVIDIWSRWDVYK